MCVKAEDNPGVIPREPGTIFSCISFLQRLLIFLIINISEIITSLRHFPFPSLSCTPLMQSSFSLKFMASSFPCYRYSYTLAHQHSRTHKENLLCWYNITCMCLISGMTRTFSPSRYTCSTILMPKAQGIIAERS